MSEYKKRVLVAPLDWGLGHASRCIPIIQEFLLQNAEVIIAGYGRSLYLLKKEFPSLQCIHFEGVSVNYPSDGSFAWTIIRQLSKILKNFRNEHKLLQKLINENNIEIVISDSRHGLFSKNILSVFLLSQVRILLPSSLKIFEPFVAWMNKQYMKKYSECWIPDYSSERNLAGRLTHNISLPKNTFYIGPLSRMKKNEIQEKDIDVLAVLSGPEPQRTIFEEILFEQMKATTLRCVIVRGKTEEAVTSKFNNVTFYSSMATEQLQEIISRSKYVFSRSGYSTVMDFAAMSISAIFIPTPEQTEQEYLAAILKKQKICYSEIQKDLSLLRAIEQSKSYSGFTNFPNTREELKKRIHALLNTGNS